jgi:hypothetical protein
VKKTSEKKTAQSKANGTLTLSSVLEKNLSAYALAAGSAGVALLACGQPADAKVVVTKVDIPVPFNAGPINFDINGDGQNDFGLSAVVPGTSCRAEHCGFKQLWAVPAHPENEVWQDQVQYSFRCAAALGRGVRIDPQRPFAAGPLLMVGTFGTSNGHEFCYWEGLAPAKPYLGVKFLDKAGNLHYGWVRVKNSENNVVSATITAYGYETIPNKPILAGAETGDEASLFEPSDLPSKGASLGFLALGSAGLSAWRREDEVPE